MSKIYTTLHPQNDESVEIYPNIESQNIPTDSISEEKLDTTLQNKINGSAPQSTTYTKTEVNGMLDDKADKSTTYTKTEVDNALDLKADKSTTYTKSETNTLLNFKADNSNVYSKSEVNGLLDDKADKSTTYTKNEVDNALSDKQETLVSGSNIKTVNGSSLLGSGDLQIELNDYKVIKLTEDSTSDLSGDLTIDLTGLKKHEIIDGSTTRAIYGFSAIVLYQSYDIQSPYLITYQSYSLETTDNSAFKLKCYRIYNGQMYLVDFNYTRNGDILTLPTDSTVAISSGGSFDYQPTLISGTNIKTVNGNSLLGSGNIVVSAKLYKHIIHLTNSTGVIISEINNMSNAQFTKDSLADYLLNNGYTNTENFYMSNHSSVQSGGPGANDFISKYGLYGERGTIFNSLMYFYIYFKDTSVSIGTPSSNFTIYDEVVEQ